MVSMAIHATRSLCVRAIAVARAHLAARAPLAARAFATRAELAAARAAEARGPIAATPAEVSALLSTIEAGLHGMREANGARFVVTRVSPTELTIETGAAGRAPFVLTMEGGGVTLSSPKGEHGIRNYVRRTDGVWIAVPDGHFLLELLARDLVYCAKGYPTWGSGL